MTADDQNDQSFENMINSFSNTKGVSTYGLQRRSDSNKK